MWGGPSCFPRQLLILQPNLSDAALAHERLVKRGMPILRTSIEPLLAI